MKSKMLIATLLGCLVWQQGVLSQTDTATATNQSTGRSGATPPTVVVLNTNESASVAATNEPGAATAPAEPAIAGPAPEPAAATPASEPAVAGPAPEPAAAAPAPAPAAATPAPEPAAAAPAPEPAAAAPAPEPAAAAPAPEPAAVAPAPEPAAVAPAPEPAAVAPAPEPAAVAPAPEPAAVTTNATPAAAALVAEPAPATNLAPSATAGNETPAASAAAPAVEPVPATNVVPSATASNEAVGAAATSPVAAVTTNATPAAAALVAEPAPATNVAPSATASNETVGAAATPPVAAVTTNATSAAASTSAPQVTGSASIPLIQFQDVPITTAIENLARQAGINYLLDPKIGYGQPDSSGQVKPEPTLSIRWENITAGQALVALLDNYSLQLVENHQTHIARITTKDPTAPPPLSTRVIQIKFAGTTNLVEAIQASFTDKRSKVLSDTRTSQLVVVATELEQEALDALISQLDKPTRQVLIETKLVEISSNPQTTKGVNWAGTLAAQHVTFGNGSMSGNTVASIPGNSVTTPGLTMPGSTTTTTTTTPGFGGHPGSTTSSTTIIPSTTGPSTTTTPSSSMQTVLNVVQGSGGLSYNTLSGLTPAIGFLNADGVSAVLSFLNTAYDVQVVSTPRVVTMDNQTATIEVTAGYPVISMAGGTQNSSGSSSVTYSNVGTILQVTPRITANDFIWLRVIPEVSAHAGDQIITVQGGAGNPSTSYTVPLFTDRRIDSQVMIPDGNTLVMGGLIQDNPTATFTKVPLLGDIPGLGWAFKSETKSMVKDNLIIFLTPTIIKNDNFQPPTSASAEFLQSRPAVMKSGMNPNSVWDGAEPHGDWSNPAPVPGEFDKK